MKETLRAEAERLHPHRRNAADGACPFRAALMIKSARHYSTTTPFCKSTFAYSALSPVWMTQ